MNRNNTKVFFITQTDFGKFSATKTTFCRFSQDLNRVKAGWLSLERQIQGKHISPGVVYRSKARVQSIFSLHVLLTAQGPAKQLLLLSLDF